MICYVWLKSTISHTLFNSMCDWILQNATQTKISCDQWITIVTLINKSRHMFYNCVWLYTQNKHDMCDYILQKVTHTKTTCDHYMKVVTHNTHIFTFNSIWSHLLTNFATCFKIVCDYIPKTNMICVTIYYKRSHILKQRVTIR